MSGEGQDAWPLYRRLLGYAMRYWPLLAFALLGMLVEAGAAGAFSAMMKPMVDETFVARNPDVRWSLPLAIVGLFVLRGIATFVTDVGMTRVGRSVVRDLRAQLMDRFLSFPHARFDREPTASMVSRLNYDTDQVAQATSEAIKVAVTDTLTILVLVGVMLMQSVKVTLVILFVAPVIGLISSRVGSRYRRINRNIQQGVADMAQHAEQTLSAHEVVKVYGAQAQETERYASLANRNLRLAVKVEATKAAASASVQWLAALALALILYIAGREAAAGHMSPGAFVALMLAMMSLLPSLKRITNVQGAIGKGLAAAQRLFSVLDEDGESDRGQRPLQRAAGVLEFERVGLRYSADGGSALEDVSFVARPGTVTAIVGRSGSGKTSLVRLAPRFYEPGSGEIRLDGHPLADYRLADLRRQFALVGQRVMLFDDSVAANIAYGAKSVDAAAVRRAAEAANALEFIERLPQGFDTRIGENGGLLSGGQRQRVAIARAILKDAPILILDEATAALDTESERLVQQALERLMPHRTTLVIAHRLSTVEHADQVLVLDNGRLVEQGSHADLLARGGLYSHLHRMQFRELSA
jgi:subfamily B ATP-binding cassette protein MsbA